MPVANHQQLLAELATHLLESDRPEEVAGTFSDLAREFDLHTCAFIGYDERSGSHTVRCQAGFPSNAVPRELESMCAPAVQRSSAVVLERIQDSSELSWLKRLGVHACACFPVLNQSNRPVGCFWCGRRERSHFDKAELTLLASACKMLGLALARERAQQELICQLQHRTEQLQRITEETEGFTYSVSHDLRAPLRAVRGFAQALVEDCGEALDDTGREYLGRMVQASDRLDKLMQDLLLYSRLGRPPISLESVSLEPLLRRVLRQLDDQLKERRATVQIDPPLPAVLAHETTLEQVLFHMVDNAAKFVAPKVDPNIRIWCTNQDPSVRIWIGDNGIGIDPEHHRKIFGVFDRLHSTEAYPGTGIGLAMVAKGMARMGGTAGVESALGEGSRFWIELPLAGNEAIKS
jgi:signal transduction histidine kinase